MKDRCRRLFIAAALLTMSAAPSFGADAKSMVKVALLDMSSLAPTTTYSMMSMMGPTMMGPGWGPGTWNNQGPAIAGQRMAYPGMMGGFMLGMMAVRIDQSSIKAGDISFDVTNWSKSILHELLIVAVDSPTTPMPYDYTQQKVPEEQVKVLSDTSDLQPNMTKTINLKLTPGSYLLFCNVPGHYAAGMATAITVTP